MDSTEAIKAVQSHLDTQLGAPVQVNAENNRPVPVVLIESWDIEDLKLHNTRYIYSEYDSNDVEVARYYHVPFELRISFLVRHDSALESNELHESLRTELLKLEAEPSLISDEVGRVTMQGGDGVSYQYADPTEVEMTQAVKLLAAKSWKWTDFDTVESVTIDIEVEDF